MGQITTVTILHYKKYVLFIPLQAKKVGILTQQWTQGVSTNMYDILCALEHFKKNLMFKSTLSTTNGAWK